MRLMTNAPGQLERPLRHLVGFGCVLTLLIGLASHGEADQPDAALGWETRSI
jgi:hypothetical protein